MTLISGIPIKDLLKRRVSGAMRHLDLRSRVNQSVSTCKSGWINLHILPENDAVCIEPVSTYNLLAFSSSDRNHLYSLAVAKSLYEHTSAHIVSPSSHMDKHLSGSPSPSTKVFIPFGLASRELHALLISNELPDASQMGGNRFEISKISVALAAIGTPQSRLVGQAIDKYDHEAKVMLRSLSKLAYMFKSSRNTILYSISGIMKALEVDPREGRQHQTMHVVAQARQKTIDGWTKGVKDELEALHGQAMQTLNSFEECNKHIGQAIRLAKRQPQGNADLDVIANGDWASTLFKDGRNIIRPAAYAAVRNLELLVVESDIAREVVGRLTADFTKLIGQIESTYRHSGQMLSVDLALENETESIVDLLRMIGKGADVGLDHPLIATH